MPNIPYERDIPASPHNPSVDQPNMKTNNNSVDDILLIDHFSFNDGNNFSGYHKNIHQPFFATWTQAGQTASPALTPIPGINQIITMNVLPDTLGGVTDTQLFSVTGLSNGTTAGVSQLTGSALGTGATGNDGYCWSGGFLFQWGTVTQALTAGGMTGNIVFKNRFAGAIAFPNNCFNVQTTLYTNTNAVIGSLSLTFQDKTGFSWAFHATGAGFTGYTWLAIGN